MRGQTDRQASSLAGRQTDTVEQRRGQTEREGGREREETTSVGQGGEKKRVRKRTERKKGGQRKEI